MPNLKINFCLKMIFFVSLIAIISAYFIEYVLGHQPCNLCLLERIPYALSIIILLLNYKFKKKEKYFILFLILIFVFSLLISIYHFGIEQSFFEESSLCNLKDGAGILSKEELLVLLQQKIVSCKDVTFRIFGLSLSFINILISLILTILLTKIFITYEKIK
jgi:disulfide bond formation protein DsbB